MKSAKFSILQLHIACTIMDLTITSLWSFYPWIPCAAGFPVGLMTSAGISSVVQTFLSLDVMLVVALSYISLFENRYDALVIGRMGRSKQRNLYRGIYFILNFIYVQCTMAFIYSKMRDQEAGRQHTFERIPCIPTTMINHPNFVSLNAGFAIIPMVTGIMVLLLTFQALYFIIFTTYHLFFHVNRVSKNTQRMQRKFFIAMILQAAIPGVSFAAPLYGYYILFKLNYFNQTYNNLLMIAIGCNGLFTTIGMILVHHPYRNAVWDMIRMRKLDELKSAVGTLNLRPIVTDKNLVVVSG
ncbi:hypothetical protein CAEBREN_24763 [Caenorhabditis brenneri]|uniref:Uncharacterized protein n=1 Tax=Caenorhabditis brenneri TaxID=135651 RepID=G0MG07_CAEBE|nr:hypothetical protein CAEBREN_24763 [Caenorhabditis brenneri]